MSGALSVSEHAGVIATLVRGDQVVTIHKTGLPSVALRAVARACDRYGWKVRSLSSPVTVYRDLDGARDQRSGDQRGGKTGGTVKAARPEWAMLGKIGRTDLLA